MQLIQHRSYKMIRFFITIVYRSFIVMAYSNKLFTISKLNVNYENDVCKTYVNGSTLNESVHRNVTDLKDTTMFDLAYIEDPYEINQDILYAFLFGDDVPQINGSQNEVNTSSINEIEEYAHPLLMSPTGNALRNAELFDNKSCVHLPFSELIHPGYCELDVEKEDYLQTALNAFAIFIYGDLDDIMRLPAEYVLHSTRTISMMKLSQEKLAATWQVVKGDRHPSEITYETLEQYRPLFKYLNAKEMAKLNLTDIRILKYIGTHPDISRHQVGVVASKYINMNRNWSLPKYLNLMNNLICGIPMTFMRRIPLNAYLQLSHQTFYHTRACDPLQRRFYLVMMTRTQALGKAYSWNAQDVARLGLLLAEVDGWELSSIKPEALTGLSSQVMMAMQPEKLQHLTDAQIRYLHEKPLNILATKLKNYEQSNISSGFKHTPLYVLVLNAMFALFCLDFT